MHFECLPRVFVAFFYAFFDGNKIIMSWMQKMWHEYVTI